MVIENKGLIFFFSKVVHRPSWNNVLRTCHLFLLLRKVVMTAALLKGTLKS